MLISWKYLIQSNLVLTVFVFYQALESHEVSGKKPATNVTKNVKKNSHSKASKRVSSKENSDSSDSEGDEEEEEVKPRKKNVPKGKMQNTDAKKRKIPAKESNISSKKQRKGAKPISEENSDAEDGGDASEDGHSEPSAEKPVKVIFCIFLLLMIK